MRGSRGGQKGPPPFPLQNSNVFELHCSKITKKICPRQTQITVVHPPPLKNGLDPCMLLSTFLICLSKNCKLLNSL